MLDSKSLLIDRSRLPFTFKVELTVEIRAYSFPPCRPKDPKRKLKVGKLYQ